ncbi:MAG: hypothetical protein R3F05_20770 [Planctomycetota bacterium]|nr:hypothetical protein [Planctomycetota bacterium]
MIPEQQRYWIALLNLQRTWSSDQQALAFIPPRHRDFENGADWPRAKAQAYLLNNLELLRETYEQLEAGEMPDLDLVNHVLGDLRLELRTFPDRAATTSAARAKADVGGRLEVLQVRSDLAGLNPGTRYVKGTMQRAFYYFAQYVDERLSDPAYPAPSPDRWHVAHDPNGSGDLVLLPPRTP